MHELLTLLRLAGVPEDIAEATIARATDAQINEQIHRALDRFERNGVARLPTPEDVRDLLQSSNPRVRALGLRLTGRIPRPEQVAQDEMPPREPGWFFEETWLAPR